MNKKYLIAALFAAGVVSVAGYSLYALGIKKGSGITAATTSAGASLTPAAAPTTGPQSIADGEAATRRHIGSGLKAGDTDPASGRKIL